MPEAHTDQNSSNPWWEEASISVYRRSVIVAALLAVLFHLLLYSLLPEQIFKSSTADVNPAEDPLELTLMAEELETAEPKYVEVNPEAPENVPDETDRYSFRNQQSADENPEMDKDNLPTVNGEEATQKILQGSLEPPQEPLSPGVYASEVKPGEGEGTEGGRAGEQLPAQPPLPLPDFLKQEPENEDGLGSRIEVPEETQPEATVLTENRPLELYKNPREKPVQESEMSESGDGSGGASNPRPMPRERPRLAPELTQGPLMQSRGSARLRGSLGIDATFSEFGEYEQQFYAALQAGWYQEIDFFQPIDTATRVIVRFTIKSDGSIEDVEVVQTNASEIATLICQTAITKRSPFRPWTKEMIQVFGNERSMAVSFRYL